MIEPDSSPCRRQADGEALSVVQAARELAEDLADATDTLASAAGDLQTQAAVNSEQLVIAATAVHRQVRARADAATQTSERMVRDLDTSGGVAELTPAEMVKLMQGVQQDVAEAREASGLVLTATELAAHAFNAAASVKLELLATSSAARYLATPPSGSGANLP